MTGRAIVDIDEVAVDALGLKPDTAEAGSDTGEAGLPGSDCDAPTIPYSKATLLLNGIDQNKQHDVSGVCSGDVSEIMAFMKEHFQRQETMLERLLEDQAMFLAAPTAAARAKMAPESSENTVLDVSVAESGFYPNRQVSACSDRSHEAAPQTRAARDTLASLDDEHKRIASQAESRKGKLSVDLGPQRLPFVSSPLFDYVMLAAIITNVIIVGVECDMTAKLPYDKIPGAFSVLNITFVGIFVLEIILKVINVGVSRFFSGEDRNWNTFDLGVVFVALLELVSDSVLSSLNMPTSHLRVFRILRLARLVRGLRVLRILRFVGSLRTLLHCILTTLKSLIWTVLLLLLVFFAFAVALTQSAADHCRAEAIEATGDINANPVCKASDLTLYWGSLPESMLTLFMAVTNGVDWIACLTPLRETSPLSVLTFIAYIVFTVLALLNVVTGVFCHSAIESASADKDIAAMIQMSNQKKYADAIRSMFMQIRDDGDDDITLDELEFALSDEKFCAYLESIDISTSDAWTLFKLIDSDKSGAIDIDTFVSGCMSLRGPASAMQLAKMNMENVNARRSIKSLHKTMGEIKVDLAKLRTRAGA